eukprot:6491097-Amphidinium_carterae.1
MTGFAALWFAVKNNPNTYLWTVWPLLHFCFFFAHFTIAQHDCATSNLASKLFKFFDSLAPLAMQRPLLHYLRRLARCSKSSAPRRSALQRAELARHGLDVSSKKRSVGRPSRQLLYEQALTKALQNDADCLTGLTCKDVPPTLTEQAHAALDEEDAVVLDVAEGEDQAEQPKKKRAKVHVPRASQIWFLKLVESLTPQGWSKTQVVKQSQSPTSACSEGDVDYARAWHHILGACLERR